MLRTLVLPILSAALLSSATLAVATESNGAHWSYEGPDGPEYWGELQPSFLACEQGQMQSPVNVRATVTADLQPIKFRYGTIPTEILNNGHTLQINAPAGNSIQLDGKTYQLVQLHFHTPSEYRIEGKEYPLEIHFVNRDENGALAVIGVMVDAGPVNTVLENIFWNAPNANGVVQAVAGSTMDLTRLLPKNHGYYQFMGSLTTPPCSEGVHWQIMTTPITASREQIAKFRERFPLNSRPLQMINDRVVVKDSK